MKEKQVAPVSIKRSPKQPETAILTITDAHFGKLTRSYNPTVFVERLQALSKKVERIHELLSDYAFDRLVIVMAGDLVDGTMIYPTQVYHQKITNINQQIMLMAEHLADFVIQQRNVWGRVDVECVPGNHGRVSKFAHESSNYDIMLYDTLKILLKRERGITVNKNGDHEDPFLRIIEVRGHRYLLYHGMEIRMFQQIPWYGIVMRVLRWLSTKSLKFDVAIMGHFHSCGMWDINQVQLILSGTMASDDDWALRILGYESASSWWLFGASNTRPITWRFKLDLAD